MIFPGISGHEIIIHVKSAITVIEIPVFFRNCPENSARISRRDHVIGDILCHDTARPNHNVVPDRHPWQDTDISADPDIISDCNVNPVFITGISGIGMDRIPSASASKFRVVEMEYITNPRLLEDTLFCCKRKKHLRLTTSANGCFVGDFFENTSGRRLTVSLPADLPQNRAYRSVHGSSLVYTLTDL